MSLDEQFDPTSRLKFSKFSFVKRDAFCRKYKHKNVGHKLLKLQRGIALLSHHLKVCCNPLRNPDSEHLRLIADSSFYGFNTVFAQNYCSSSHQR